MVRELLETKAKLLASLAADYETYLDGLSELEVSNKNLAAQVKDSADYIGEHVLWIRSSDALWIDDIAEAAQGTVALTLPNLWFDAANLLGQDLIEHRNAVIVLCLVVVLSSLLHARLATKMMLFCSNKSGGASLRFRPTIQAVMLAAIIATEWPLAIAFLGWRMSAFATVVSRSKIGGK